MCVTIDISVPYKNQTTVTNLKDGQMEIDIKKKKTLETTPNRSLRRVLYRQKGVMTN